MASTTYGTPTDSGVCVVRGVCGVAVAAPGIQARGVDARGVEARGTEAREALVGLGRPGPAAGVPATGLPFPSAGRAVVARWSRPAMSGLSATTGGSLRAIRSTTQLNTDPPGHAPPRDPLS